MWFDTLVFRLETAFSHPDCTCCRLVFTDVWLLFSIQRTHLGLSKPVKNTVWRKWGCQIRWEKLTYVRFLLVKAVVSCCPWWQVCLLTLSCRRWFPDLLLWIPAAQAVRPRPAGHSEALSPQTGTGLHHRAAPSWNDAWTRSVYFPSECYWTFHFRIVSKLSGPVRCFTKYLAFLSKTVSQINIIAATERKWGNLCDLSLLNFECVPNFEGVSHECVILRFCKWIKVLIFWNMN